MRLRTGALVVLFILSTLTAPLAAETQQPFRITFHRDRDEPSSIVLVGGVANDSARDVVEVWVTAEASNSEGQVVARGISFVSWRLPGRGITTFTVKLPRAEQAQSFRVFVSSFRYLLAIETP